MKMSAATHRRRAQAPLLGERALPGGACSGGSLRNAVTATVTTCRERLPRLPGTARPGGTRSTAVATAARRASPGSRFGAAATARRNAPVSTGRAARRGSAIAADRTWAVIGITFAGPRPMTRRPDGGGTSAEHRRSFTRSDASGPDRRTRCARLLGVTGPATASSESSPQNQRLEAGRRARGQPPRAWELPRD